MPAPYPVLPFPRGTTYTQGAMTPAPTVGEDVVGTLWRVRNPDYPAEELVLRAVRYVGSDNLVPSKDLMEFDVLGETIIGKATTDGAPTKPLDPALMAVGTVVKQYDIVYVVESGKVAVAKGTASGLRETALVMSGSDGKLTEVGSSDTAVFLLGVVAEDALTADTTAIVDVYAGFPKLPGEVTPPSEESSSSSSSE
ncbi:MAG TPA: hypothetical protein P5317_07565 [Myxococcota bacterium]|nr:hypothetical protein [Myxococcota bacterium]